MSYCVLCTGAQVLLTEGGGTWGGGTGGSGTGGSRWGHLQGAVHMAAIRIGSMVGTSLANSHPGCMSRLRKCHSQLLGGHSGRRGFLGSKRVFAH